MCATFQFRMWNWMWEIWLSHVRLGNIQKQSWTKQSKTNCYQWISKQLLSLEPLNANSFSSLFQLKKSTRDLQVFYFLSNTFMTNNSPKSAKNKQKLSKTLRLNFRKKCPQNKFVCFNKIKWLHFFIINAFISNTRRTLTKL